MSAAPDIIARYEGYRQVDPANVMLLVSLGQLYHEAGRFDDAAATLREALAIDPAHAGARSRLGSVLISQHRFADAEALLQPLAEASPGDAALQHNLGLVLFHQHKYEAARQAFAAARSGGDADTWAHLAYASHHLGDMDTARQAASQWAALAPSSRAEGYLSVVELDCRDHEAAYRRANALLQSDPDNTDALVVSGVQALELQDMDRAAGHYEKASSLEPDNARAWVGVALVRLYREEHVRAIEAFERALALDPRNTGTLVALGWAHFTRRDYPEAEAVFRRAIEVDRNFAEAHGGLASALVMLNRRDEARAAIALAKRLSPQGFGHVYARAVLLGLDGRKEQGAKLLDHAFERSTREGLPSLMEQARVFMGRRPPPTLPPPSSPGPRPPRRLN